MSSISFARFPTIPIPFQNLSRESVFRTLSKHQKATQVGLAAIGLLSLYFGIQKSSMIATGMGVLSLGLSYKLPKIINTFFTSPKILIQRVNAWHQSFPHSDLGKDEALSRIKAFIENPSQTNLDLSGLKIPSLPEIFDSSIFERLESLDLSGTQITSLPENFNPPNLEWLYLHETAITSLSLGFSPPNLKKLYLSKTPITSLPAGFNPPNLETLNLHGTQITSLPENFNPPNLEWLYLSYTPITTLPVGFSPPNLKKLHLSKTQITSLPAGFNPPYLECLYLSETQITSLPAGFNPPYLECLYLSETLISSLPDNFNPPNLKMLDLARTQITSLPDSILDLPNWCTVYLTISNFSNAVQGQIRQAAAQETGPHFSYHIQDRSVST